MRRLTIQELRKIQLEILDVVANFCDENNINYWLNAGTLLGAIRHKGFIPWDDDVDLGMLRPDYDKFMKLFNENNTRYKFYSNENTPGFFAMCGRVVDTNTDNFAYERTVKIGIYIDIFVFDNAPDNDELVKKMFAKRNLYEKYHYKRVMPLFYMAVPNIFRRIFTTVFRAALRVLPRGFFSDRYIKNTKSFNNINTKRVGDFTGSHKVVYDREILEDLTTAEFEGKLYKIPRRYDEFLQGLYGNYMQLPPVGEQKSKHKLEVWTLND